MDVSAQRQNIFYPFAYKLTFTLGSGVPETQWTVTRSYKQIRKTHTKLKQMIELRYGVKRPQQIPNDWPMFPIDQDNLITWAYINERCVSIGKYLERVLAYPPYREHSAVLSLLGVSKLSFVDGLAPSVHEGWLRICSRDYVYYGPLCPTKFFMDKVGF